MPVCLFCVVYAGFLSLVFFALSCLTFTSQTSFHLSLRPRRASTFFRKESRQRFARGRGSAPFEPPFLCPAADLPFPRAAGRLSAALWAANRRLTGKRLKSQGAKLSFSSVSVRRGTPVPFRQSPPLPRCWPAYAAFQAANRRLARETPEKPKEQSSAFRAFLCVGERLAPHFSHLWKFGAGFRPAAGNRRQAFARPGKTEAQHGPTPENSRVRARLGAAINTVRELPGVGPHSKTIACVRDAGRKETRCANCSAQPRRCADPLFIPCKPFEKGWRKLSRGADPGRPCNFPASQVS